MDERRAKILVCLEEDKGSSSKLFTTVTNSTGTNVLPQPSSSLLLFRPHHRYYCRPTGRAFWRVLSISFLITFLFDSKRHSAAMRRGVEHRSYKTLGPSDRLRDTISQTFKSYQKQRGPAKVASKAKKKKMKKEEDSSGSEDEHGQEMTTFRRPQEEAAGIMKIKGSKEPKYGPVHSEVPVATPDAQQPLEIDDAIGKSWRL